MSRIEKGPEQSPERAGQVLIEVARLAVGYLRPEVLTGVHSLELSVSSQPGGPHDRGYRTTTLRLDGEFDGTDPRIEAFFLPMGDGRIKNYYPAGGEGGNSSIGRRESWPGDYTIGILGRSEDIELAQELSRFRKPETLVVRFGQGDVIDGEAVEDHATPEFSPPARELTQ